MESKRDQTGRSTGAENTKRKSNVLLSKSKNHINSE